MPSDPLPPAPPPLPRQISGETLAAWKADALEDAAKWRNRAVMMEAAGICIGRTMADTAADFLIRYARREEN